MTLRTIGDHTKDELIMRTMRKLHHKIRRSRKLFNEYTLLNRTVLVFSYLLFFFVLFHSNKVLFSKAPTATPVPTPTPKDEQITVNIKSNELLVKVKKSSKSKVRTGITGSRGIKSLDALSKTKKLKQFERAIKTGSDSTDNIYSWYVVTFDEPVQKLTATYDKKSRQIWGNDKVKEINSNLSQIRADSDIETAEPNYIVSTNILDTPFIPNDPYFSTTGSWGQSYDDLWGVKKIKAPYIYQLAGPVPSVVAVIDTGVDRNHPDMSSSMWVNTKEIPGNGKDDDGNGYIDDYYGWDFANNDNDPMDDYGHGTHVAGIISAGIHNSVGITGISFRGKIMALKFMDASGNGYLTAAANALKYSADNGAKISSNSWGCGGTTQCWSSYLDDAIYYAYNKGQTIVASAGNSNMTSVSLFTPASSERVITVGSTDWNDARSSFSNYGAKIDVMAPGSDILSLKSAVSPVCGSFTVGSQYCHLSGTSMAAPFVSGTLAVLLSLNPNFTQEQLRQIIRTTAFDIGTLGRDMINGYGRLDIQMAVDLALNPPPGPFINNLRTRQNIASASLTLTGSADGPTFKSYRLDIGRQPGDWKVDWSDDYGLYPTSFTTVKTSTVPVTNGTLGTIDMSQNGNGLYTIRLVETDKNNKEYVFEVMDVIVDSSTALIEFPRSYMPKGSVDIYGKALVYNSQVYDRFDISWGVGANPSSWLTTGVTKDNTSNITGGRSGKLASLDTSSFIVNQLYTLKLTVYAKSGASSSTTTQITVDPDMVSNFPKMIPSQNDGVSISVPAIADIDGDGKKEIIVQETLRPGKLHAYRKDGTELPGFPITYTDEGNSPNFSVNIADLNGDGKKEIITTRGTKIFIYQWNGTNFGPWPLSIFSSYITPTYNDRTPIVADINGDGTKELISMDVLNATTGILHVLKPNGTYLPGFPKTVTFTNAPSIGYKYAALAAADMNGDGKMEIAFPYGRNIYLYDANGNLMPGWPYVAGSVFPNKIVYPNFSSSATFGDVNADGKLELFAYSDAYENYVYLIDINGQLWKSGSGWPETFAGAFTNTDNRINTIGVADVDNDAKDEMFGAGSMIDIYNINGPTENGNPIIYAAGRGGTAVTASDLTGDKKLEFISSSEYAFYEGTDSKYYAVLNWANNTQTWERRFLNPYKQFPSNYENLFRGPVMVADMDNNGKMELVVVMQPCYTTCLTPSTAGGLYVWEITPTTGTAHYEWPMLGINELRSGRLNTSSVIMTPTPAYPPCTGQCKGDQAGTSYASGTACFGIDNVCYVCKTNGNFAKSPAQSCPTLPTSQISPTPTPVRCKGQCYGDSYGTYPSGYTCYGVDAACYTCGSNGFFSKSTTACAGSPTPVIPTTTGTITCRGQCKGDPSNSSYTVGHTCYGNDNACYVCGNNGNFSTSQTACNGLPTPVVPTTTPADFCIGECKGDSEGTEYPVGHACYGNDDICYVCGSNGNFSTSESACGQGQ